MMRDILPLSRRAMLAGGGALAFAFALGEQKALAWQADGPAPAGMAPNMWLTIHPDNRITIISPSTELGQGSSTHVPIMLADEMDADWALVDLKQPDFHDPRFINPEYGFYQQAASATVLGYYRPMRLAGAQVRLFLRRTAAAHWSVPETRLQTGDSMVRDPVTGQKLSYGQIATLAPSTISLPPATDSDLKPDAALRLIGGNVPRRDIVAKTRGAAQYSMDVRVEGMVYAALLPAPHDGAKPARIEDSEARKTAGFIDIAAIRDGIAVVARSFEAAMSARDLLVVDWTDGPAGTFDSDAVRAEFLALATDPTRKGALRVDTGDALNLLAKADRHHSATFSSEQVYHAQMEPLNAVARVAPDGKSAELWVGTQSPSLVLRGVAGALQTTPDVITLHAMFVGGGFGRRTGPDYAINAALIARKVGLPVKLIYDRTTDMHLGQFRPITAHSLAATLGPDGRIAAWYHRIVSESVIGYKQGEPRMASLAGVDTVVTKGSEIEHYGIPAQRIEYLREKRGSRVCYLRGVGATPNQFAIESFIDRLAASVKTDPLTFRLNMTRRASPRATALLEKVKVASGWPRAAKGRAMGVAMGEKDGTMYAHIVEASLDRATGTIKVHKVWVAVDCGRAVQPDNVIAQTEGGVMFGLGPALRETITIRKGRVQQSNLPEYLVARMEDAPEVQVFIVPSDHPISGGGEAGVPALAPAINNALFALTGKQVDSLPMSPPKVLAALRAKA